MIAVANTTNGQDIESFTEDFYDSMGYGQGEKKSGIMLMVSMKERQWNMCTTGDAIDAFTDAGLDYIGETFITYLSDEKYNKAFTTFARLSDKFLNQAEKGKPYDSGHMPKGSVSPFWIFGDLAIGILIALIWGNVKKAKLKSVKKQVAAQEYTKPGSLRLTMNSDRFVNRTVTTRVFKITILILPEVAVRSIMDHQNFSRRKERKLLVRTKEGDRVNERLYKRK